MYSPSSRRRGRLHFPVSWIWFTLVIILAIVIVSVVSSIVTPWIKSLHFPAAPGTTQQVITTLNVQRTAAYAGLDITVVSAQYAVAFADDTIHSGFAIVRLTMQVANHSGDEAHVLYCSCAHLLVPKQSAISPTNTNLSVGPRPNTSESGWIDFPVPKGIQLDMLSLQLGSTTLNESLVTIPFKGAFDPGRYTDKSSQQNVTFSYTFIPRPYTVYVLTYHITRVDIRFAYQGNQCKTGQKFYIISFKVDNPYGVDVTPGWAYDYVRLVVNGYSQAPLDSTLPDTFKARASGTGGQVVFAAPAGMHPLTIGLLPQNGGTQQDHDLNV